MKEQAIHLTKKDVNTVNLHARYYEYGDITYNYADIVSFPLPGETGMNRFLPLLPVEQIKVEIPGKQLGDTDLQKANKLGQRVGLNNFWIKREDQNPTSCLKDRESAIVISAAVEKGESEVYIVSSGNAALSTAAYAHEAGIPCTCYVPEKTTKDKMDLIKKYGGELKTIPGFYEDVYRTVVDADPPGWNVTTGQNEYRVEGIKTISYELYEQLGEVPDVIVIPSGNGGAITGVWKGFVELKKMGITDKLPQMVSVQIKDAAPFAVAFANKEDFVVLGDIEDSIAEGIVAQESYCSPKAMKALHNSGGYVIEVTDEEIKRALKSVIELENFIPEPTSAAVYAALPKLKNAPDALVVAINTGGGEKMKNEIMKLINE